MEKEDKVVHPREKDLKNKILWRVLQYAVREWRRNNRSCDPRLWSNDELRKFAQLFTGDVINLSAGKDGDKEGSTYRAYFSHARSYGISNYTPVFQGDESVQEVILNLGESLAADSALLKAYDVVFTHTVLEHIYENDIAVSNICRISRDVTITIVPWLQSFHSEEPEVYQDHWRYSPFALALLFGEHGFETLYVSWNNDPLGNLYIFHVASRQPEKWEQITAMQTDAWSDLGPGYLRQQLLSSLENIPAVDIAALKPLIRRYQNHDR